MANAKFPNQQDWFIGGSNPSIFPETNNSTTLNYLLVDGAMVPSHGKGASLKTFTDNINKIYKSNLNGNVYLIANQGGYSFDSTQTFSNLFTITKTNQNIDFFENENNQIGITTGAAYYVFNYGSGQLSEITSAQGLQIADPVSCALVDTIGFIAGGNTFQATKPNAAGDLTNDQTWKYETVAGNILKLGVVNRTLFVVANNGVERWVVIGGDELLQRDNVFFENNGLYDEKSFVNKLDMMIGLFTTKYSGADVLVMTKGQEQFQSLTEGRNGIVEKILSSGPVKNADLYKISNIIYYELCFENYSFIYSFQSKEWTESTSPNQQIVAFKDRDNNSVYYSALDKDFYPVTLYSNTEKKRRQTAPLFLSDNLRRFTIGQLWLWYNNENLEKNTVFLSASIDGDTEIVDYTYELDEQHRFSNVSRHYGGDCWQFSLIVETYSNVIWRGIASEAQVNG